MNTPCHTLQVCGCNWCCTPQVFLAATLSRWHTRAHTHSRACTSIPSCENARRNTQTKADQRTYMRALTHRYKHSNAHSFRIHTRDSFIHISLTNTSPSSLLICAYLYGKCSAHSNTCFHSTFTNLFTVTRRSFMANIQVLAPAY